MDGLVKIVFIMLILYGMGKLGPRTRKRMEKMGRRLRGLFCEDPPGKGEKGS